ncbi:unnamed protein product [Polarella glacialis]|uniref:Uncharacterized protein n=1 Tax=Polarella glacialis TaxID=89957 RepID=A0A813IN58_POLGL|nr:unnamed protein product [Polarella glacialis]
MSFSVQGSFDQEPPVNNIGMAIITLRAICAVVTMYALGYALMIIPCLQSVADCNLASWISANRAHFLAMNYLSMSSFYLNCPLLLLHLWRALEAAKSFSWEVRAGSFAVVICVILTLMHCIWATGLVASRSAFFSGAMTDMPIPALGSGAAGRRRLLGATIGGVKLGFAGVLKHAKGVKLASEAAEQEESGLTGQAKPRRKRPMSLRRPA